MENVLAFGPAIGFHEVVTELIAGPHIAFDLAVLELFRLGHHSVVSQVHILIGYLLNVVVDGRESDVALPVDPYGQGVPIGDEHPLANVKLLTEYQHRVLDVLLHDPLPRIYLSDVLHHLLVAAETLNAPASGLTPRLKYPRVAVPIYIVLWVLLPQLLQQLQHYLHIWILGLFFLGKRSNGILSLLFIVFILFVVLAVSALLVAILVVVLGEELSLSLGLFFLLLRLGRCEFAFLLTGGDCWGLLCCECWLRSHYIVEVTCCV